MGELAHGITLTGSVTGEIGEITNIGIPGQTRDSVETTTMDATNKRRTFMPGLIDSGEITFSVEYDGAASGVAASLEAALKADAETWTVEADDATTTQNSTWACEGFVTNLGRPSAEVGGKITQEVTIKLSGEPTFTPHD